MAEETRVGLSTPVFECLKKLAVPLVDTTDTVIERLLDSRGDALPIGTALRGRPLKNSAKSSFDLVFLDSERSEYPAWWPDVKRILRKGGLLVADKATSHAAEMAPFAARVAADSEFTTCTVSVGAGEFPATQVARQSRSPRVAVIRICAGSRAGRVLQFCRAPSYPA